jgi:hypothetical protein
MKYFAPVLAAAALALASPALTLADDSLGKNAALQYWLAFAAMPQRDQIAEQEKQILAKTETVPLDGAGEKLIHRYDTALEYLRRGAALKSCSWGLKLDITEVGPYGIIQDYAPDARQLARAACLRARYAFAKGDSNRAVAYLLDVFTLARHVGGDGTAISKLDEYAIENMVVEVAAANLGAITDIKTLTDMPSRLRALPRLESMAQAFRNDKEGMIAWIRTKRWAAVEELLDKDYADADESKRKLIRDFLGINDAVYDKLADAVGKQYDEAAAVVELPLAQYEAAAKAYEQNLKTPNLTVDTPVLEIVPRLVAPPVKSRLAEVRSQARFAMLLAGLAIVSDGKGRLMDFKDPFGDGPFEYREVEGGFELKSKADDADGSPVALVIHAAPHK